MIKRYVGILLAGVLLSSCFTVHVIQIDQMEPGKINLPEQVRKICLLSRNFKFDIDTLGQYYISNFRLKKTTDTENKGLDSIAVTKSFDSLRKILLESGRFDEIAVYPYATSTPHFGKIALPLSPQYVKKLCEESGTDAIVSLEMLSYFYNWNSGNQGLRVPQKAEVKITAIWAVYFPGKDTPVDRFKYSDVIRWNENRETGNLKKLKVPPRNEGIEQSCGIAVKNYSKRLVPYWTKSERYLVSLEGANWEKAMSLAQKYKWYAAAVLWQSYSDSKKSRERGAAALDVAIAKEMLGDYEQASFWSDKSLELLKGGELRHIAVDYANLLKVRRNKTGILNRLIK